MTTRQVYEFTPPEGTAVRVEVAGAVLRLILEPPAQTVQQEPICTTGYSQVVPQEPTEPPTEHPETLVPDKAPAFSGAEAERAARVIVQYLWVLDTGIDYYGIDRALLKHLFDAASETLAGIAVGLDIYLQETIAACRLLVIRGDSTDPDVARALMFLETPLRVLGIPDTFTYSEAPVSFNTTLQDIVRAAA